MIGTYVLTANPRSIKTDRHVVRYIRNAFAEKKNR
jgi:hypothetical protein